MKTTLRIEGMHCADCVRRLTSAFERVPGVTRAHVTLSPPEAHIESSDPVPPEALTNAARSAGNYSIRSAADAESAAPAAPQDAHAQSATPAPNNYPLVLILLYIAGAASLTTFFRADDGWSWHTFMNDFMAGFFLVFSFFKFLDLRGFADAYQSYDVVARTWRAWGFIYPFVEAALGIAYLLKWQPVLTSWVTLAVMLVGSVGVLRALLRKDAIRCACLGTTLNLPMSTISLVEDLGMAAMSAAMLLWPA